LVVDLYENQFHFKKSIDVLNETIKNQNLVIKSLENKIEKILNNFNDSFQN
jgi:uncharacterized coiled-coil protein SlyX